jgi:hypothetical protein
MTNKFLNLILAGLLLAGCATIEESKRQQKFDETILLYEKSIRWGDFASASLFLGGGDTTPGPATRFDGIKVTSYRQVNNRSLADGNEVVLTVQIDYYHNDTLKVMSITDVQNWKYDAGDSSWRLHSPLPAFR